MHRQIVIMAVAVAAGVCLEYVLERWYRHTESYRRSVYDVQKFMDGVPTGLEIVNVGSEPGLYDISYQFCKWKGFNFSTAPQNFSYSYKILQRFSDHLKSGCIIIIIMCPLSFGDNQDYQRKDYSDKYYGILSPDQIEGYSKLRAAVLRHTLLVKCVRKAVGLLRKVNFNIAGIRGKGKPTPPEENATDIMRLCQTWEREFNLKNLTDESQAEAHRNAFKEKQELLEREIGYCISKGWRPVFVVPPLSEELRPCISDSFKKTFVDENLSAVQSKCPSVPCLDYYKDTRVTSEMYRPDGIFLNERGQKEFSRILFDDIGGLFDVQEVQ